MLNKSTKTFKYIMKTKEGLWHRNIYLLQLNDGLCKNQPKEFDC